MRRSLALLYRRKKLTAKAKVHLEAAKKRNKDFSTFINGWKKANVEILLGNTIPPDFITAWRQCKRLGFRPKVATIGKAILFPSAVGALGGDLPNGLTTEVWWSPHHPFKSSLTGESAKNLCDAWTKDTGKEWTQPTR